MGGPRIALAIRQRPEHAGRALEQGHVLPGHVLELGDREEAAEGLLDIGAHLVLMAGEVLHAELEIARQVGLQAVVVVADHVAQEADRQQVAALAVLFQDDLGQDRARDVLAGLGVEHHELLALAHHLAELVERDVAAGRGIVEPAVGVFLDHRRLGCRRRLRLDLA